MCEEQKGLLFDKESNMIRIKRIERNDDEVLVTFKNLDNNCEFKYKGTAGNNYLSLKAEKIKSRMKFKDMSGFMKFAYGD